MQGQTPNFRIFSSSELCLLYFSWYWSSQEQLLVWPEPFITPSHLTFTSPALSVVFHTQLFYIKHLKPLHFKTSLDSHCFFPFSWWIFSSVYSPGRKGQGKTVCVPHNYKLMLILQATITYSTSCGSLLLNVYGQPLKSRKHQTGKHENEFRTHSLRPWQIVVYLIRAKNWD